MTRPAYLNSPEYREACARVSRAVHRQRELYHEAISKFATANDWKISKGFSLRLLASGKMHDRDHAWTGGATIGFMLDHPIYFRCHRRPVAIVANNYRGADQRLREYVAGQPDLYLHEPPEGPAVSWYSSDAFPMAITRFETTRVIWPSVEDLQPLREAEAELSEVEAQTESIRTRSNVVELRAGK